MGKSLQLCQHIVGFGLEGWVPKDHYEMAMVCSKKLKEEVLVEARLAGLYLDFTSEIFGPDLLSLALEVLQTPALIPQSLL